ncbi:MAG: DUF2723 domain-containing protein [Bacteroidales bacterium]|nr:DUF2723 domain-containing protein [Bacteroidales bacterium]
MEKKTFDRINHIVAVVVLAISCFVYLATIEPTASFWDCGEFIASSYKLEVGHPPGNPVFQLFARMFAMFSDGEHAAAAVNCMSAVCSGFTIFFLFLTIVHFGRRILEKSGKGLTKANVVALMGAGVAGSLAYCFSDTFWFSAVEAEVYAMSSLLTAIVFWAILKWEEDDGEYANRWIVLICLLMGLSIDVHLLNLLAIPPIVFIYYYKNHKDENISLGKSFLVLCLSALPVALILFGIIPYLPKILGFVDRIFVNGFKLGYNSGATVFMVLLFAALFLLMKRFRAKGKAVAHTVTLCLTTIIIGYSAFAVVIIRASANTPTNEYQPDNPYTLARYLAREQYGSNPIIYGQAFTSTYEAKESTYYTPLNGQYYKTPAPLTADYPAGAKMFFPRMWSNQSDAHTNFYEFYTEGRYKTNTVVMSNGERRTNKMPYFKDNLRFFFDYQMNHMYWRYFMWNFVGRQNDIHGQVPGDPSRGNWESGIGFIDKARLGDQSVGPDFIVNSKAKNHYFFLPLLLGLIGFFFQLRKDSRNSWVTFLLFFLTGIAIIIYLNQPPYQVRERDYAYAGSFYVFTIWIGLAVLAVKGWFERLSGKSLVSAGVASALCIAVAILMGCQNWDDHDRSNRYTARDYAYNYLQSCDKDAILFTHGDNDTFPLWYLQEVEGIRTDVRIMNTSLLGMDWYIDQMKCKVNDSKPVNLSLNRIDYLYGTNDYVPTYDVALSVTPTANEVLQIFKDQRYRTRGNNGIIASRKMVVPVNKENAVKYGIVPEKEADQLLDYIELNVAGTSITKTDLVILDLLSNYEWDRPIYFVTEDGDCSFQLGQYLRNEGFIFKLVPQICTGENRKMDAELVYDRLMHIYEFDRIKKDNYYIDYQNLFTMSAVTPLRNIFINTAEYLYNEGEDEKALQLLDKCFEVAPNANVPYNLTLFSSMNEYNIIYAVDLYLALGETEKANEITDRFIDETVAAMAYYAQPFVDGAALNDKELERNIQYFAYMISIHRSRGNTAKASELRRMLSDITGSPVTIQ